jgi:hypothetical protein
MFTTLEIVLIAVLVYLLIGIALTLLISKGGIMDTVDIALTTFLWVGIPFIFIHNKLKKIIE